MTSDLDLADTLYRLRPRGRHPYIIGLTGAVASGKSTLAAALAQRCAAWPGTSSVEVVSTDGFLRPNAELEAAGLTRRKGFPETYDAAALAGALQAIRRGPAVFPVYSHKTYDVDPALAREVEVPDVLITEGLGLSAATPLDILIYLDAGEADLEAWYVRRFLQFWREGLSDPASFYARFAGLDAAGAGTMAKAVWTAINLPNLREQILPIRDQSDIVVSKGADHAMVRIEVRTASAPQG